MSDLIRREETIEILTSMMKDCFPEAEEELDAVVTTVKEIPSAEPERKWIPVTEALPEEEKDVLVSVHFEGHKCSTVDHLPPSDYVEIASHVDGFWSSLSDEYKVAWSKHHVVAWMPTPEPWRGE